MSEKETSEQLFDQHPVWTWNSSMDGFVPVEPFDPLPDDGVGLFVRARFVAASGEKFNGYVVEPAGVYALGLFLSGHEFVLNLNLPDRLDENIRTIRKLLNRPELKLFPLQYEDDVGFQHSPRVVGEINVELGRS